MVAPVLSPVRYYAVSEYRRDLTCCEIEIIRYLMLGHKEAEVARQLGISCHTVHSQIASAHRKLNVSGRARLIATVIAEGIVPVDEVRRILARTGD